jgi:hypothetical protein
MGKKNLNGTVATLTPPADLAALIDEIDDPDGTESTSIPPDPETVPGETEGPAPDSEEAVLSKVESFEQVFGSDPLAADYDDFGSFAKTTTDPRDGAVLYVTLGIKGHNLQVKERNLAPASYDRAAVSKKLSMAARLHGVPESMNRPHEWIAMYWVAKLDRSDPGEPGQPRSFHGDAIPADWFGGNISYGVLRVLSAYIKRVSKDDEMDVWEFTDGFESTMRDLLERLRKGTLSGTQAEALLKHRKSVLKKEREDAEFAGLTEDERRSIKEAREIETREKRLTELGSEAVTLAKSAAEKLKMGKAALATFLANKGVIPPQGPPSCRDFAKMMTPGDAKGLVQALVELYPNDPTRGKVFWTLHAVCNAVAKKLEQAAQGESTVPLRKTGS